MNIEKDKLLHFAGGTIATTVGILFAVLTGFVEWAFVAGIFACAIAAIGREIYNHQRGGPFDWYDVWATMLGAVPQLIAVAIIEYGL